MEQTDRIHAKIPKKLKVAFKLYCVKNDLDMQQVITELIEQKIKGGK